MHHLDGPKNMSLENLICALPVTLLTPGLMTLLRLEVTSEMIYSAFNAYTTNYLLPDNKP